MRYVCYFRHPRTKNEMTQYFAASDNELEIPVKVRGRRKPKSLPNAWDDIYRCEIRNWKRHRKTRWRG